MLDLVCMGEALIDFLADRPGVPLTQAKVFTWAPGGAPANVAVAAAKLDLRSGFLGKVGNDPFGHFLRDTLQSCGVDTSCMLFCNEARTALAFVALPSPDNPQFIFYRNPSADMLLRPDELDREYLRNTQAFHFGSISLIAEPSRSATLEAAKVAKEAHALISFDPNYRPALWPPEEARKRILTTLPLCDLLKLNEEEVRLLSGTSDLLHGARQLLKLGPAACLVTLGPEGSLYVSNRSDGHVPSFRVKSVDATGCGDGFMAAAIKGVLQYGDVRTLGPGDFEEILRFANAVGALTATKKGGIPALPTTGQVNAFLSQFGP
jgi:fructokinase